MTPDEMRKARKGVPMTQEQLGKALGYSRMSIIHWEKGMYRIPEHVAAKVLEVCVGVPVIPAEQRKVARLTADTIKYYGQMRRDGITHAAIMALWHEKNFIPTPEAQAAIAAEFPDILA
jgi:DNA-binding XRE family transcriptional regulator